MAPFHPPTDLLPSVFIFTPELFSFSLSYLLLQHQLWQQIALTNQRGAGLSLFAPCGTTVTPAKHLFSLKLFPELPAEPGLCQDTAERDSFAGVALPWGQ